MRGGGGIFIVTVENQKIWDKKEAGRFPTEREIIEKLEAMISS